MSKTTFFYGNNSLLWYALGHRLAGL